MAALPCAHGNNAPDDLFSVTHHNQAGNARHRCVTCAYAAGLSGLRSPDSTTETCERHEEAPEGVLSALPASQAGPGRHGCAICAYAFGARRRDQEELAVRNLFPDEVPLLQADEGAVRSVMVNVYERDPGLRAACIQHHGSRCRVCQFDFGERYGELGRGFIHVHHLRPLSEAGGAHRVDAIGDLVPVCPNCHAMMHMRRPPLTPEQLAALLR